MVVVALVLAVVVLWLLVLVAYRGRHAQAGPRRRASTWTYGTYDGGGAGTWGGGAVSSDGGSAGGDGGGGGSC